MLILPAKRALHTKDPDVIIATLRVLQQLVQAGKFVHVLLLPTAPSVSLSVSVLNSGICALLCTVLFITSGGSVRSKRSHLSIDR